MWTPTGKHLNDGTNIVRADRSQQRDNGVNSYADADQHHASKPRRQLAARNLEDHIAPEEGGQDHALDLHVPVEGLEINTKK